MSKTYGYAKVAIQFDIHSILHQFEGTGLIYFFPATHSIASI